VARGPSREIWTPALLSIIVEEIDRRGMFRRWDGARSWNMQHGDMDVYAAGQ
jgi:hypothetical protein